MPGLGFNFSQKKIFSLTWGILTLLAGLLFISGSFQTRVLNFYERISRKELQPDFWIPGITYDGQLLVMAGILIIFLSGFIDRRNKRQTTFFTGLVICSVIVFFTVHFLVNAVNVPIWDDYDTILGFANRFSDAASVKERALLIAEPFYESRMVMLRLFTGASIIFFGSVNFKIFLMLIFIINLILVFVLMGILFKQEHRWPALIPVALWMFQFQSYDTALWTTSGFNFSFTFLTATLAVFCIRKKDTVALFASLLFAMAAALTYGNGWIICLISGAYLLYTQRYLHAALFSLPVALLALWYFQVSSAGPHQEHLPVNWYHYPVYYFAFCGSAFRFFNKVEPAFFTGLVLHAVVLVAVCRGLLRDRPVIVCLLVFIFGSAMLTTVFRTADGGITQALSPRYGFYSQVLVLLTFAIYFRSGQKHQAPLPSLFPVIGLMVWQLAVGLFYYPEAAIRKNVLVNFIKPWQQHDVLPNEKDLVENPWLFGPDAGGTLSKAKAKGVYVP